MNRVESLIVQCLYGAHLMARFHAFAKSIGCTTYESGALSDSIEVHTDEQARLLAEWWEANTTCSEF